MKNPRNPKPSGLSADLAVALAAFDPEQPFTLLDLDTGPRGVGLHHGHSPRLVEDRMNYLYAIGLVYKGSRPGEPVGFQTLHGAREHHYATALAGFENHPTLDAPFTLAYCARCGLQPGENDDDAYGTRLFDDEAAALSEILKPQAEGGYGWTQIEAPGQGKRLLCQPCTARAVCLREGHTPRTTPGSFDEVTGRTYLPHSFCDRCGRDLGGWRPSVPPRPGYPQYQAGHVAMFWDEVSVPTGAAGAEIMAALMNEATRIGMATRVRKFLSDNPGADAPRVQGDVDQLKELADRLIAWTDALVDTVTVAAADVMFPCPDCNAAPNTPHDSGCDVALCTECGHRRIICTHGESKVGWGSVWTGRFPGDAEVREYSLRDLNHLGILIKDGQMAWSVEQQRWTPTEPTSLVDECGGRG